MAIGKAAKWISFATPQQTQSPSAVAHDTDHSSHSIADEKQFGFENFGNTCYANSVLQALYFCSPFRDLVIQSTDISAPPVPAALGRQTQPTLPTATSVLPRRKSERGKPASDVPNSVPTPTLVIPSAPPTLFSALRSLFVFISRNPNDKGAVAPRAFIDKLRDGNELFRGVMHQDAHEFLNYLLNKIVEEIQYDKHHEYQDKDKDASSSNASREDLSSAVATLVSDNALTPIGHSESPHQSGTLVHRLFEGTLTSETRCLTCETVSSRDESFLDLSIDIEQNSSVTACLRQFSASEMLCQRNKFFCDSCCGLQEAEKRMKIKKLPNILALHLKRFKYQEDLKKYIKLTYRVAFPFELRLFNTVDDTEDPDRLYELFGIVVHIGSGPHHGHYVAIVKGPHSWLMFDDDKIEAIKESEIPRYFGDAASGSAYVLYYQAVDLDPASLGIKVPVPPTVPDVTIAGSPAHVTTPNGLSPLESPDLALPPGLGESSATSPAAEPIPHPPIPTAPSSPSLATLPLVNSVALLSQKKSLPSIRIPAPDSSTTSPTTSGRTHGGLFNTFRSSPSSSKTRPSTSDGTVSRSVGEDVLPPVPPVPFQYLNGKETKDHDKDKDKDKGEEKEKEREEERSSKEFDRKPSLWFKRRNAKLARDEREKEKEKEKDTKGVKDKDVGSAAPGHATTSATALSAAPSQSDAVPSVLGASSLWRRSSARVGYHVKRLSGGANSSTALGEADGTATATAPPTGGSLGSNSSPSHPPPHPRPHPHHSHSHPQPQPQPHQHQQQQQNHHHHHHHHREPPGRLPTVPATPQVVQSDWEPSTPSSTSSFPPATRSRSRHTQAQHSPPPLLLSNTDDDEPPPLPPLPVSGEEADVDSSSSLPGWRISPASLRGKSSGSATSSTSASAVLTHHHSGEPTSMRRPRTRT
ncbi:hypothetical protein DFH94DRAFT_401813 [Russula ochroleuca]|uniref:Ubiquitin carboxyl-terminal hydrolase n=1 Tax=Russula ochroleuca TaxID=152965 RepID=A0A9P5MXX3_9AGAM|nr:hypothetical protein DFH94DRAFT_401813 [Russula ochroleuca]